MAYIDGSDLMVFMGGTSIANAQSHTLNLTNAQEETSTKDVGSGGWTGAEYGKHSFSMTTDNLVGVEADDKGNTLADIMDAFLNKETVEVVFALKNGTTIPADGWTPVTAGWYQGQAIIQSLTVTAQDGQKATYTATFQGTGALTKMTTTP